MFKYIVIAILMFAGSLQADDLWSQYRSLRSQKFESVSLTVKNHLDIAAVAKQLNRSDIEAWNYNNAAYVLIKEFRKVTTYDDFNRQISAASSKHEKIGGKESPRLMKRNEFRKVLQANWQLLAEAQEHLHKAIGIGYNPEKDRFIEKDLGVKINSNQDFIRWVYRFMESPEEETVGLDKPGM